MKYIKTYNLFESELSDFIRIVKKAKTVATDAHKGQYRRGLDDKGNKVEYIKHPELVAKILHEVKKSEKIADLVAAAFLHDTLEDTDLKSSTIRRDFGDIVANLVKELTSNPEELEKLGKEKYLMHKMLNMSSWGLVIKLADRLSNVMDIPKMFKSDKEKDVKWAKKYAEQTYNIIEELKTNRELSKTQKELIKRIEDKINSVLE